VAAVAGHRSRRGAHRRDELEELPAPHDAERHTVRPHGLLLGDLGQVVAEFRHLVDADDGERHVVADTASRSAAVSFLMARVKESRAASFSKDGEWTPVLGAADTAS
jgi:hypothetical protein